MRGFHLNSISISLSFSTSWEKERRLIRSIWSLCLLLTSQQEKRKKETPLSSHRRRKKLSIFFFPSLLSYCVSAKAYACLVCLEFSLSFSFFLSSFSFFGLAPDRESDLLRFDFVCLLTKFASSSLTRPNHFISLYSISNLCLYRQSVYYLSWIYLSNFRLSWFAYLSICLRIYLRFLYLCLSS